jgi:hypothetical protein
MASTWKSVVDTMHDMNLNTWSVKSRSGSLIGYQHDQKIDVDTSVIRLRKLLEGQQGGDIVKIELAPPVGKGGDRKNIIKLDVDVSTVNTGVSGFAPAPTPDFSKLEKMIEGLMTQNQALQAKLIESKYENQIKDLQAQISGVNDDPIGRVIDLVIPILAAYVPKMTGGAPGDNLPPSINGVDPIERLLAVDPEGMKVIEAIVSLAENKPEIYRQYKPILFSINGTSI